MQWGNGIMGSWGYVYKKEGWRHYWTWSKSKFRTLSYPLQTHADGRNDNNEQKSDDKKERVQNFLAKCPLCTGALPVLSSVSAAARHTAARRVQRSVWVCVCHRRLHVRSPELALASSSVLPPRLFRRHGRTCAYSTTQLYTSEPLLLLLTASVFSNIIILLKWMTKKLGI